jgi:chromosome segregation ATPase
MSTLTVAAQIRQMGELFSKVAPHIEDMDALAARKAELEKRCIELQANLTAIIETTNAERGKAQAASKAEMDRADAHWKHVTLGLEQEKAKAARELAEFAAKSKEQIAAFDARMTELQTNIRMMTAQRDKLSMEIGKLRATISDTMAAL